MDFSSREIYALERMEDLAADPVLMTNSYAQFRYINGLVSSWRGLYRRFLRPSLETQRPTTLLDIGFGGGDVVAALGRWAEKDGLRLDITAIDSDRRAFDWVQGRRHLSNVKFLHGRAEDLAAAGQRFDWVISNHVLHHLDEAAWSSFFTTSCRLAGRVLHCDLVRSRWAYFWFRCCIAPWFRRSYIAEDGLLSVRRSYTVPEMRRRLPRKWRVTPVFPFHQMLCWDVDEDGVAHEDTP